MAVQNRYERRNAIGREEHVEDVHIASAQSAPGLDRAEEEVG
jgi:hypothetical protein